MATLRKRGKQWYYRYFDADGVRREVKGCTDKRVTEGLAREAESHAARVCAGLIDVKEEALAFHEARCVDSHAADWKTYLEAKGVTQAHADVSYSRVHRILDKARSTRLSDLTPSRIQSALKAIQDDGVSLGTAGHYVRAVKGFSRWLWRDGRVREDSLTHLKAPNSAPDRRRVRRALSATEQAALIAAAERGGVAFGLSGVDRAMLYRVALGTGFRRRELRSLTPLSFALDEEQPTITVAAAYSKHRRDDVQPIRSDLAGSLRTWLAQRTTQEGVFGTLTDHTTKMLRKDLQAAGIPYRDASNRVVDFHSLRVAYITALAQSKARSSSYSRSPDTRRRL